jgi:hypothetical protein
VSNFYELKSTKWKQPLNILENGFLKTGLRISSPFKIFMPDIWASKSLIPTPGQVRRGYCRPEQRFLYGQEPAWWRGGGVRHCALVAAGRFRLRGAPISAGAAGGVGGPGPAQSCARSARRQLGGGNLLRGQVHRKARAFRGDQRGVGRVRTPLYIRHRSAYTTGGDDVGAG